MPHGDPRLQLMAVDKQSSASVVVPRAMSPSETGGWTLALVGTCAFVFAIVTYRLELGELGIAAAALGVVLQRRAVRAPVVGDCRP